MQINITKLAQIADQNKQYILADQMDNGLAQANVDYYFLNEFIAPTFAPRNLQPAPSDIFAFRKSGNELFIDSYSNIFKEIFQKLFGFEPIISVSNHSRNNLNPAQQFAYINHGAVESQTDTPHAPYTVVREEESPVVSGPVAPVPAAPNTIPSACHHFITDDGKHILPDWRKKLQFYWDDIQALGIWFEAFAGTVDGQRKALVALKKIKSRDEMIALILASECKKHLFPKLNKYLPYHSTVQENLYSAGANEANNLSAEQNIVFEKYLNDLDIEITRRYRNK